MPDWKTFLFRYIFEGYQGRLETTASGQVNKAPYESAS